MEGWLLTMRKWAFLLTSLILLVPTTQAEIFKCIEAGKRVYSDQPCADNAEKFELNVYQPKAEDIEKQQQMTQQYQRYSQHNAFLALRSENERLEKNIIKLQKERDQKLKVMSGKI